MNTTIDSMGLAPATTPQRTEFADFIVIQDTANFMFRVLNMKTMKTTDTFETLESARARAKLRNEGKL